MGMRRETRSRYTLMRPSRVLDEESGEVYPDILTADYQDFDFSRMPKRIQARPQHVDKPFNLTRDFYGTFQGDDILLDVNLVPHKEYMEPGMILYIPASRDMEGFVKQKTPGERRKL